ncbi:type VII secretion target [Actinosynnema sp. NPDC020468]|uniref:type VII secretion target n=1 Tax=Actinosynnema sp. NPDC020468 TaxID=3154488 RepID=UPI0033D8277A
MTGYRVTTSELETHAASVRRVSDTLGQALDAARQVTLGVQAYGLISGPLFVPIVTPGGLIGQATLELAQQAMNDVAKEITDTAAHYDAVEKSAVKGFGSINGGAS